MEGQTITVVTRQFGVSTRTLRYYEQMGLIESTRVEGYAYRVYDDAAIGRLRQIFVLRALRIPLKEIAQILRDGTATSAIALFTQQMNSLDEEIASLSTIRDMLRRLLQQMHDRVGLRMDAAMLDDPQLLRMAAPLLRQTKQGEQRGRALTDANRRLNRVTDRDVRVLYLPPAWVAAYREEGDNPEMEVNRVIDRFVREHDLVRRKPDLRHYGFNAPNPEGPSPRHGYEMWVTIPEKMDVPAPLERKHFAGGLYAAYMIPMGAFEMWEAFSRWVSENERYEYRSDEGGDTMFGCLEEHLNYVNHALLADTEPEGMQLDLLIPIREKQSK